MGVRVIVILKLHRHSWSHEPSPFNCIQFFFLLNIYWPLESHNSLSPHQTHIDTHVDTFVTNKNSHNSYTHASSYVQIMVWWYHHHDDIGGTEKLKRKGRDRWIQYNNKSTHFSKVLWSNTFTYEHTPTWNSHNPL